MTPVFSGGLVYEWSQEPSDYGLVELSNGNITLLQDYQNLKAEFAATSMPSGDGGYKPSGSASTCPVNGTDFTSWAVLPALPPGAQNYIDNGAGKALGYTGPSNQGAGGAVPTPSSSPSFSLSPIASFLSSFCQLPLGRLRPGSHANERQLPLSQQAQAPTPQPPAPAAQSAQVEAAPVKAEDIFYWLQKEVLLAVLF